MSRARPPRSSQMAALTRHRDPLVRAAARELTDHRRKQVKGPIVVEPDPGPRPGDMLWVIVGENGNKQWARARLIGAAEGGLAVETSRGLLSVRCWNAVDPEHPNTPPDVKLW